MSSVASMAVYPTVRGRSMAATMRAVRTPPVRARSVARSSSNARLPPK